MKSTIDDIVFRLKGIKAELIMDHEDNDEGDLQAATFDIDGAVNCIIDYDEKAKRRK